MPFRKLHGIESLTDLRDILVPPLRYGVELERGTELHGKSCKVWRWRRVTERPERDVLVSVQGRACTRCRARLCRVRPRLRSA